LNKTHRIVWSEARGAFIVAHEHAATSGKRSSTKSVIAQSLAVAALIAASAPALSQTHSLTTGENLVNSTTIQGTSGGPGVAAFGVVAGSITNSGTIASATAAGESNLLYGVFVGTGGGISGGITNSGTVSLITGANLGINIISASTVGNIVNGGTITGTTVSGITIAGGSLGAVSNTTTTSLIQGGTVGIAVMSGATAAGIVNAGTISGNQTGIYVTGTGTSLAGINNIGVNSTISGGTYGISVESGAKVGNVVNQGSIVGGQAGLFVNDGSTISSVNNSGTVVGTTSGVQLRGAGATIGSVTNSGSIIGSGNNGVALETGATVSGALTNAAGGVIQGMYTGVYVEGGSTLGSLVNSGSISNTASNGGGVVVSSGAKAGSIQNLSGGVISGGSSGIRVVSSASVGSVTNAGTITARGAGIQVYSASSITGAINNSGLINSQNSTGIRVRGNGAVGSVINSGTVSGGRAGIEVYSNSHISSGVTNSGLIVGGTEGVLLGTQGTIAGGLTNSGTITGNNYGVVLYSQSTISGGVTNSGSIGGAAYGIVLNSQSTISGGVTNSGTIGGGLNAGIIISSESSITGGIHNLAGGVISGASTGISLFGSTVDSISNAGHINSTFDSIGLYTSTVTGGISNLAGGTLAATTIGIYIDGNSTVSGGIANSGTISAYYGIGVFSSTVTGGINNLAGGVITAASGDYGIFLGNATVDSISNAGNINETGAGASGGHYGIFLTRGTITGQITNSGVITASGAGIGLASASTVAGGISNSGSISGAMEGIMLTSASTVAGGISNSGLIASSAGDAIDVNQSTVSGGLVNSGTIQGAQAGVKLTSASVISGGLMNSGSIIGNTNGVSVLTGSQVQGGVTNLAGGRIIGASAAGVLVNASTVAGSISNAGAISGAAVGVNLIDGATVAGLANSGYISGGSYSVYTDATSVLGPITISGKSAQFVGDVYSLNSAVSVTSGSTFTGSNAFNVASFDVASGATLNMGVMASTAGEANGITVSNGVSNEGTLSVARNTAAINGSYTQAASGVFGVGVASKSDHGVLAITGAANLSPAANINVTIAANNTLTNKETIAGVLTSGDLTASTFNVTDNSDLISFKGLIDGNNVDLVTSFNALVLPDVLANHNSNAVGAATVLDQIILASGAGNTTFSGVINDIAKLQTSRQVSDAASQTLPVLSGDVNVATYAALTQMNQVVQSRVEGNYGMSAGSPYVMDQNAWVRPFGSWADAGNQNGAPGFSSGVSGVALGGDAAISNAARVGLGFAYANVDVSGNSNAAPNNDRINMYQLMGYGSYALDPRTEINAQIDGGINSNDGHRNIDFAGTTATSSFNSSDAHVGIGIARELPLSDSTIFTPQVRVDYTWISTDDYSEGGAGPLNLNVKSTSFESLLTTINGKLTQKLNDNLTMFGNLGIGYDSMAHTNGSVVAAFAGAPGLSFSTDSVGLSPRALLGGIGLMSTPHGNAPELSFRYDIQQREGFATQSVSFKARWAF
jgi:uncharacterized protein with beta-barrel porin domain